MLADRHFLFQSGRIAPKGRSTPAAYARPNLNRDSSWASFCIWQVTNLIEIEFQYKTKFAIQEVQEVRKYKKKIKWALSFPSRRILSENIMFSDIFVSSEECNFDYGY